jgi:hypothetical protein
MIEYRYGFVTRFKFFVVGFIVLSFWMGIFVFFLIYYLRSSSVTLGLNIFVAMSALLPISVVWAIFKTYDRYLPIFTTNDGIGALLFQHQHRFLKWSDIRKIEKVYQYDSILGGIRDQYVLHGISNDKTMKIQFDQSIDNLQSLLTIINMFAKKFAIEMMYIDRSRSSRPSWRPSEYLTRRAKIDQL